MGVDVVDVDALLAEIFLTPEGKSDPYPRYAAEGLVVFDRLLERFTVIEPAWGDGRPVYRDSIVLHGLESLPMRIG